MASFSPKAKKKPEQSGLCSDVAGAVSLDRLWPRAEIPGKAKGLERVWLQALAWCATPPL